MLLAVMDLGSNSFKMTVAQWAPEISKKRPFRVLHKERYPIQLGASVFSTGQISAKDFKLAFKAIEKMQARLRDFSSPILRVVATSAIRDAANGREFVNYVRSNLGVAIEVISGNDEARLIAHGLNLEYPRVRRGLLIDIGGGSTEVASFGSDPAWALKYCHSFKVGSVRLATQFFQKKDRKKRELEKVRRQVRNSLRLIRPENIDRLVGSAGTIQSLGQIFAGNQRVQVIRKSLLDAWIESNFKASSDSISKRYKLQPSRARVIVPGAIVLSEIMTWLGARELTVTGMTLRDGVMVDLVTQWNAETRKTLARSAASTRVPLGPDAMTDRELLKFLESTVAKFQGNLSHAAHVARLAVSVYDQMLGPRAPFLPEERRYLLAASYLHDIGKIIGEAAHQKHGAYIIRNLRIPGFSPLECKKIALMCLFHRKDTPTKKDPLPLDIRGIHADQVRRLTAILRLVDGLDKDLNQNTDAIAIRFSKKQAFIELQQWAPERMDQEYFRDKAAYFEELFECKIVSFVHHKRRSMRGSGPVLTSGGAHANRKDRVH